MNIPPDSDLKPLSKVNGLSRDTKKNYYLQLLRKLLKANVEGFTASQVSRELNSINPKLSYNSETLSVYLAQLASMREAYTTTVGSATVYKYNGRLLHADKSKILDADGKAYYLIEVENPNLLGEHFVVIQEREKTSYGIEKTLGGIMISTESLTDFTKAIKEYLDKGVKDGK